MSPLIEHFLLQEWGPSFTHIHLGSFRLEMDQSWTPIEQIKEVSLRNAWAHRMLDSATINSSSFLAIDQPMNGISDE